MNFNINRARQALQHFDFQTLFIEELGWNYPDSSYPIPMLVGEQHYQIQPISELGKAMVYQLTLPMLKDSQLCKAIGLAVQKLSYEHLIIFTDASKTKSVWQWIGRKKNGREQIRKHSFIKGQTGDLFMAKLARLFVSVDELSEEGEAAITLAADKLKNALNVEQVTKRFFADYQEQHLQFVELIEGIDNQEVKRWYASILLHRLMFIYFLQKKFFVDKGNVKYLQDKLQLSQQQFGDNQFYQQFLLPLFFEGFAKAPADRSPEHQALLGEIVYLNGGLFLKHRLEKEHPTIQVPDKAFANLFSLFERYSWNLNDEVGGNDQEINPDVLGFIFEKYINQKAFGAYYTRPEITTYLCQQTIHQLVLQEINPSPHFSFTSVGLQNNNNQLVTYTSLEELLLDLSPKIAQKLLFTVLPNLSLLDPACGSGAFLMSKLQTLVEIYTAIIAQIPNLNDKQLNNWLSKIKQKHPSILYYIKKQIITNNLYGVDIMEEATEIAKLRLFLSLVSAAKKVTDLEPLPNIDFNIMCGNALIGLLQVDAKAFNQQHTQGDLFTKSYQQLVNEKNVAIHTYKHATTYAKDLQALKDNIYAKRTEAIEVLNQMLTSEFQTLKIKFEEQTWNAEKNKAGKAKKRTVKVTDVERLKPFHWGYEFSVIFDKKGGFDAIITNPPWDVFKPNAREFFKPLDPQQRISKKNMKPAAFTKVQQELLDKANIQEKWLDYLSQFPHISNFYRKTKQFQHQISRVNGRKQGSDINLYKLFVEQSYNLLKPTGFCGMVIPSGIYTDLGTKQLRHLLFSKTRIQQLFSFANEKFIFDAVDHRFKFCLLSFEKGKTTTKFPAAFRINPREAISCEGLPHFFKNKKSHVTLETELIQKLSPDSLSIMEFRKEIDALIAQKMALFPLLGEYKENTWNLKLSSEFHMTSHRFLFKDKFQKGYLPLYEGKMIHQFKHDFGKPRYWVEEKEARQAVVGKRKKDKGQILDYQQYRLVTRAIARNTDRRTIISSIIPKKVFCGNSLLTSYYGNTISLKNYQIIPSQLLVVQSLLNSIMVDYYIRQMVSANINMFYLYQLPIPRLTAEHPSFQPIVEKAARLICTTEAFADLWQATMQTPWTPDCGITEASARLRLRAKLDATIAHLYGLNQEELQHILQTFPLLDKEQKARILQYFQQS